MKVVISSLFIRGMFDECECDGTIVIKARHWWPLWQVNDGGGSFEGCCNDSGSQRGFKMSAHPPSTRLGKLSRLAAFCGLILCEVFLNLTMWANDSAHLNKKPQPHYRQVEISVVSDGLDATLYITSVQELAVVFVSMCAHCCLPPLSQSTNTDEI